MKEEWKKVLEEIIQECHKTAVEKGFWKVDDKTKTRNLGEALMLVVSELSEALEAVRQGDMDSFTEELADACIRVFDLAGGLQLELAEKLIRKMEKNKTRPFKHGKLF